MKLTADLIEAFAGTFISPRYDMPRPTPPFHRAVWKDYASDLPAIACAAPRDHAKSTGFTMDYGLAELLFRTSDYIIVIGSTEELAQEQLSNISEELHENEDIHREFGPYEFETEQKTELIVKFSDGHRARILARGAEQRIRGRLWKGKRPNLLICDDMEDDEQVESKERRVKFRRWFFRAARQALGKGGRIRVHGTILHDDSLLARLMRNETWHRLFFKAHRGYDDFRDILWPERWSEAELRMKRAEFEADNDGPGYAQEYLNDPQDFTDAFIRPEDLIPMNEDDHEAEKLLCAAADFAVSKQESADNTSFTIGGKCVRNFIHVVDQRTGHWDAQEIIQEIFNINEAYAPHVFFVEDGVIWKTIYPTLEREMHKRDSVINFLPMPSTKDQAVRGVSFQRRTRAHGMRFDTEASWWPAYKHEILRFTAHAQALKDDQFDSTALLCRGFDTLTEVEPEDFITDEEQAFNAEAMSYYRKRDDAVPGFRTGYR